MIPTPISHIPHDHWAACPVCGREFARTAGSGRSKIYCSAACRLKEFRFRKMKRNYPHKERTALVQQQMAVGDWRLTELPAWPRYTCLACGRLIASASAEKAARGVVGPAWYDHRDFDLTRGIYRRVLGKNCVKKT